MEKYNYYEFAKKGIVGMLHHFEKTGKWEDSEKETEDKTLVFKACEALTAPMLCRELADGYFQKLPMDLNLFKEQLKKVLNIVEKNGYDPDPYSYLDARHDFVDFASQFIILLTKAHKMRKELKLGDQLNKTIERAIKEALQFLNKTTIEDSTVCRWAGTAEHKIKKVIYGNVYFTSWALQALIEITNYRYIFDRLTADLQENARKLIHAVVQWLLSRYDGSHYYGDDNKTKIDINYCIYGLRALLSAYDRIDEAIMPRAKEDIENILKFFCKIIEKNPLTEQFFIEVSVKGTKKPYPYDDRSSEADVVVVLCIARKTITAPKSIEFNSIYYNTLAKFRTSLITAQNSDGVWYESYEMTSTLRAIEACVLCEKYSEPSVYEFGEDDLRKMIIKLADSKELHNLIVKTIDEITYKKRLRSITEGDSK